LYILYFTTIAYEGDIFRNAAAFSLVEIYRILGAKNCSSS